MSKHDALQFQCVQIGQSAERGMTLLEHCFEEHTPDETTHEARMLKIVYILLADVKRESYGIYALTAMSINDMELAAHMVQVRYALESASYICSTLPDAKIAVALGFMLGPVTAFADAALNCFKIETPQTSSVTFERAFNDIKNMKVGGSETD